MTSKTKLSLTIALCLIIAGIFQVWKIATNKGVIRGSDNSTQLNIRRSNRNNGSNSSESKRTYLASNRTRRVSTTDEEALLQEQDMSDTLLDSLDEPFLIVKDEELSIEISDTVKE